MPSNWQTLSTVKAAGNSNSAREYNKLVDSNAAQINYYRLKQINLNGNFTYSQIIRIRSNAKEKTDIMLYPNPIINNATVTINSENKQAAHIKLYNQFGMQLNHLQRQSYCRFKQYTYSRPPYIYQPVPISLWLKMKNSIKQAPHNSLNSNLLIAMTSTSSRTPVHREAFLVCTHYKKRSGISFCEGFTA